MSKTRKWMLVLLSVCFLFSLAFGIAVNGFAEGETEIELPNQLLAEDWSGNTELRIPSNLKSLNQAQLTYDASMLDKVKITSGDKTYACSNIYEWNGELTFYFNGSGYTGKTPAEGDVLSVAAGLTVTNKEGTTYVVSEDISWTYDGSMWVKDGLEIVEVDIELPDLLFAEDWSGNMEIRIPSNLKNLNNQQLTYDASMLGKVKVTSGDKTYACSHIYEWNGELTFYFNGSGYTGTTPAEGDVLSIDAGLQVANKEGTVYTVQEAMSWTYTGGIWVKSGLTAAKVEYPSALAASDWNSDTEVRIPSNLENNNQSQLSYPVSMLSKVKIVRGGTTYACSHVYEWGGKITFYFNGSGYTGKTAQAGDKLIIEAGLQVTNKNNIVYYTAEDVTYTCDGVGWTKDRVMPERDYESLTTITIESVTTSDLIGGETDSVFFINTTSTNAQDFGDDNYENTYTILPYLSFVYPDEKIGDVWCVRVNGRVARLFIHEPGSQTNLNANTIPEGGVLTIKAGFGILNTEAVKEDVSFVYNGTAFVPLVEPDDFTIATANNTEIKVGESLKIEVTDAENVTAYYRFSVSDTSIATVNALGVVTGMAEGTVTVSVWYGDLEAKTIDLVVTPITAEDIREFAIVDTIETFRIPVSTAENPTSLWNTVVVEGGFVLKAEYTLENGVVVTVDITEEEIEEVDYSAPGSYTITIKDDLSGLQDTVNVVVYDYTAVGAWDSIGVSGYDVNDERNAGGTWNGHMMIGMNSYSTNTYNMTGGISNDVLSEMAGYVVYTRADGTTYQNTEEDKPISLWELSSNILVMIRPEGYTGTMGYGVHKETNTPIPIYNQGDTIQFKKGMPIYLYVCNSAKTEGYFVVEGYLEEDYTYYCYSDNGTSSLWQLYIEYTDFTVNETIELGVNSTAQIGAVRVPADATTGTFSYESSDTSVVTINASGNMVGMKVGTATITITLEGGKDEEGNLLDPIVKVVTVNVTRSVASVSGTGTIVVGTEFDASKYEVTITYTDGTSETMKLNAEGVVLQAVDTSAVGEQTYNVMVTVDGTSVRGTFVLTVTEKSSGCKSIVNGTSLWGIAVLLLGAAAMIVVARKRTVKK